MDRLNILVESDDGFKIAECDMKTRGPGDMAGIRQSGIPTFSFLNIIDDFKIFEVARDDAKMVLKNRNEVGYNYIVKLASYQIADNPLIKG